MVYLSKWKVLLVVAVCLLGLLYAAPNLLNRDEVERWAADLPG
ncbi:MAG: putative protein-export rane protein SecD, partial [Pseudomonadota bacterium]